jgi:hypothetical protein
MSNVLVEAAITDTRSDGAPAFIRLAVPAVTEPVVGPRPAFGHPFAIRLSAELVAVIAQWLHSDRRQQMRRSHPEYRRSLL